MTSTVTTARRDGLSIADGPRGIVAQCEAITGLAAHFGAASERTLASALRLHAVLAHPALLGSGLLDPGGLAVADAELGYALDGPGGLTWLGAQCALLDAELRAAAAAYRAVDELDRSLRDDVDGVLRLPGALDAGLRSAMAGNGAAVSAQRVITTDPELADELVDALGLPTIVAGSNSVLPDGRGVAHGLGTDRSPAAARPPRGIADVLTDLEARNDDPHHGAIDVRVLTMADGTRRVIVDITGTKSWTPLRTGDVTSLTTNGRALLGRPGAYEDGVLDAMRAAGVRRTDPVMIVGHSEGGMVAVTTARDAARSGEFQVTHVITAGSPVGRSVAQLPRSIRVLALENDRDLVPHLDGAANPDRPNIVTVRSAFGDGTIVDDHSLSDAYVPLGRRVDASHDGRLAELHRSLRPYWRAVTVQTHAFQVTRRYP